MSTFNDLKIEGSTFELSLSRLIGKPIKDVRGYFIMEYGDPVFEMTKIEFEDGSFLGCEGEHDTPYLVNYGTPQPNYDTDNLWRLVKQDPDYEGDEGDEEDVE